MRRDHEGLTLASSGRNRPGVSSARAPARRRGTLPHSSGRGRRVEATRSRRGSRTHPDRLRNRRRLRGSRHRPGNSKELHGCSGSRSPPTPLRWSSPPPSGDDPESRGATAGPLRERLRASGASRLFWWNVPGTNTGSVALRRRCRMIRTHHRASLHRRTVTVSRTAFDYSEMSFL